MRAPPAQPRRPSPAFWRSFPMFESASDAALAALTEASTHRTWPAGAVLFQRGDAGSTLVALAAGRVRLSLAAPDGRELVLAHAEAGDILGEIALFDAAPRSADATVIEATSGYVLARAGFEAVARGHPDLWPGAVRFLCRRLRDASERLEGIALYGLEARVARFLLLTLRALHGEDLPPHPRLRMATSQSELAALLGASRPKVNRALQALVEADALTREGAAWACDVAALRTLAEGPGR